MGKPIAAILAIQIFYSIYLIYFDYAGELPFNFHIRLSIAEALLWLIASLFVLNSANSRFYFWLKHGLMAFAVANASVMVTHHFQGKTTTGFIPSHTIASTFLACTMPWFFEIRKPFIKWLFCLLQVLAIFFAGGSTGILCLVTICIVYCERIKFAAMSALILAPFLVLMPKQDLIHFWDPNGRVMIWTEAFRQWGEGSLLQKFIGFGVGSWEWLFPIRFYRTGQMHDVWLFAHNDYVQIFYEMGIVGSLALVIGIAQVVKRCKDPVTRSMVVGYLLAMGTQSVMRIACLQILGICLIHEVMSESKSHEN